MKPDLLKEIATRLDYTDEYRIKAFINNPLNFVTEEDLENAAEQIVREIYNNQNSDMFHKYHIYSLKQLDRIYHEGVKKHKYLFAEIALREKARAEGKEADHYIKGRNEKEVLKTYIDFFDKNEIKDIRPEMQECVFDWLHKVTDMTETAFTKFKNLRNKHNDLHILKLNSEDVAGCDLSACEKDNQENKTIKEETEKVEKDTNKAPW